MPRSRLLHQQDPLQALQGPGLELSLREERCSGQERRGGSSIAGLHGVPRLPTFLVGPCGVVCGTPHLGGLRIWGGSPPLCCRCDVGRASQGSRRLQTPGAGLWGTPGSQEAMDGLKRVARARAELGMVAGQLSASLLRSRQGKATQQGGSPRPVLAARLSTLSTGCPKQKTRQLFPGQPHGWVTPRPQSFPKTSPSAGHRVLVARVPSAPSSARCGEQAGSP